jgi:monoamine oxidase
LAPALAPALRRRRVLPRRSLRVTTRRRTLVAAAALALPALGTGCRRDDPLEGGWVADASGHGHAWRDGRWPRPEPGADKQAAVAIVGAGVAGLAAARALVRAGMDDFRIFELEEAAGGNARAHAMDGRPCPLGAHYLPLPGPMAHEVSEWLHETGLARRRFGRTEYDERHLCHAPQERIFVPDAEGGGQWLDGLMPAAQDAQAEGELLVQARRFAAEVGRLQQAGAFAMPTWRAAWSSELAALDRQSFAAWLQAGGYSAEPLRWYLDYCCRDDYGAASTQVSAWAGLHYFASRHGFRVPGTGDDGDESGGVLTWPEGNAWLVRRLAAGLGERLHPATVVTRIAPQRHGVAIDAWDLATGRAQRWQVQQAVLCLPLRWAARLVDPAPPALAEAARRLRYAPWLVSNLQLREPLLERNGPPMAWDNVLVGVPPGAATGPRLPPALGYVNASHQSLASVPAAPVLTHYWALGGRDDGDARHWRGALLREPWTFWARQVVADLARAHPDLPRKLARIDLTRYGHAMSIPVPGVRSDVAAGALAALAQPQGRLHFAHADLSGYSVFEEAFTRGTLAGQQAAATATPLFRRLPRIV